MTSRELEILNIIYRLGGQCSMRKISKETGLSSDYAFLIAKGLLKQKLIKKIANDVFILTEKKKTPTLIEVSRSFGKEVEPASFEPEIHFISPEAISSGCCGAGREFMSSHNLSRGQITEKADARSIQKSLKRLIAKGRNYKEIIKL